jgi:hypothetical protein
MPDLTRAIADIVGRAAMTDFNDVEEHHKPALIRWATSLPGLADAVFLDECTRTIYDAAVADSFRAYRDPAHFKASACGYEAKRRHAAAGHSKDCRGDTLYAKGYARAMRQAGHTPPEPSDCTCGAKENR